MPTSGPTILSVEPDSAWVVIFAVSLVTFVAALLLRKVIAKPGGLASGIFLSLPLVVPLFAAIAYAGSALPEVGVLQPAGRALRDSSGDLLHLLLFADSSSRVVTPYALSGTAGSWILVFGIAVSSFMLIRRLLGAGMVARLVRRCSEIPEPAGAHVRTVVEQLAGKAGLKKVPGVLLLPAGAPGAFAVGTRRSRILISRDLLGKLDPDELEAILAHEVAHLEAHDCQVMYTAGFLRDLVAWNPIAHLSYRRLMTDRELEADRRASSLTGRPLAVAASLVKVCELVRSSRLHHRALVAFLKPGSRINRRVANLLALADERTIETGPRYAPYMFAAVVLAALGLSAGARIASQNATALAITWGSSEVSDDSRDFRDLYLRLKQPPARRGMDELKPQSYSQLANQATLRSGEVDRWLKAMDHWARSSKRPLVRLRWESRQDWRAVPLFGGIDGPFDIYTIERQPL